MLQGLFARRVQGQVPFLWGLSALGVLCTAVGFAQTGPGPGGGGGGRPDDPPPDPEVQYPLYLEPVARMTTGRHAMPEHLVVPAGVELRFFQPMDAGAVVTWTGANEVSQASDDVALGSVATRSIQEASVLQVRSRVERADGTLLWENSHNITAVNVAPHAVKIASLKPVGTELNVEEGASNEETMFHYFKGSSIAAVSKLEPGKYRTSIHRPVMLRAMVSPRSLVLPAPSGGAEAVPLIEWRVDGEAKSLGLGGSTTFETIGSHKVSVGPPKRATEINVETYKVVRIDSDDLVGGKIPEGVPVTFRAVTDPTGFENDVTWLSSTQYGTGVPTIGSGQTFTTQFDETFGSFAPFEQWLGVRADNVVRGQDQNNIVITDVTPLFGSEGTQFIINGSGFDSNPVNHCVLVGGVARAAVLSASPNQLVCEIGPVLNPQTGDVVVLTGEGQMLGDTGGSFPVTGAFRLDNGFAVEAGVKFQLTAATADVFSDTVAGGNMTITLAGNWPAGSKAIVDLHLLCTATNQFKEIVFMIKNDTGGDVTSAVMAAQIAASITSFGGAGVSATSAGDTITIMKTGGISPTVYTRSTITRKLP